MPSPKKPKSALEKLTPMQRTFVLEYALDRNKERALIEAGYTGDPSQTSAKLLANPKVKAALSEVLRPHMEKYSLTIDNVLRQLANFLFRDVAEFLDEEGYLITNLRDLPEHVRQAIDGWEVDREYDREGNLTGERFKPKLVPKIKAQQLAMDYLKLLGPKNVTQFNQQFNFSWKDFCEQASSAPDATPTDAANVIEQRIQAVAMGALEKPKLIEE